MLDGRLEDGILPVGTLTQNSWVRVSLVSLALYNPTIVYKVLIIFSIFAKVHHVEALHLAVYCQHTIVGELCFASLTAFGGNEYHTIGTLGTIDSGGRCIFQNLHGHDIRGVQG